MLSHSTRWGLQYGGLLSPGFSVMQTESNGPPLAALQLAKLQGEAEAKVRQAVAAKAVLVAAQAAQREGRLLSPKDIQDIRWEGTGSWG